MARDLPTVKEIHDRAEALRVYCKKHGNLLDAHNRLAGVIALLLSKPVVSIPMIAKHLNMSQRAAATLIGQLGSTPRLITPRNRYRLWQVC